MKKKVIVAGVVTAVILTACFFSARYLQNSVVQSDDKLQSVVRSEADKGDAPQKRVLPLGTHLTGKNTSDLEKILKRKYLRVLTTINRTNFYIHNGHLIGYEYSLLKEYESYLNRSRKNKELKTVMEFIPVARDQLFPMLNSGYGDIAAAGLTITAKRREVVDFTAPYLKDIDEIAVTAQGGFAPETRYDLAGRKVWVRKSSSYYESLEALNRELEERGSKQVQIIPANEDLETEILLEMVNANAVSATVADSHIAEIWSEVLPDIELHREAKVRSGSQIAWAVRKNNPQLKKSLNRFLEKHKKGSLLGNIYFNRYYKNSKKLKNPGNIENWDNLKNYKNQIKKYAKQYNFDWLLIMAVAFQESGLDNSKTSTKGAVGVMQVLPSTALDKKIAIDNIHKAENNIHAGVKYLDFVRSRYFSGENIAPNDRVRLALAAYNAGPAKIRRARALTEKMGLNPDRWFRNVEIGTLRLVGEEPVTYVSNINKYYLIYKNMLEQNRS
ncbi:MAG: transporter substrate-binding domain-containing protein [Desulfobacteraceae bacterium]